MYALGRSKGLARSGDIANKPDTNGKYYSPNYRASVNELSYTYE